MKVLVLNGSPKKKSDTMELTNAFLKGFNSDGTHDIEILNIIDMNVKPCRGCFGCWANGNGKCVIEDDQNMILEKYSQADLVIWSFPLYCFGFPSHIKAVLDRMIPLVKMDMEERNGEVHHKSDNAFFKTQKTVIICGAGFPNSEGNFDGVRGTAKKCFPHPTMLFVSETPMLNVPGASELADIKRAQFEKGGREYAQTGCLCEATAAEMQSLMIPNADYISIINGD